MTFLHNVIHSLNMNLMDTSLYEAMCLTSNKYSVFIVRLASCENWNLEKLSPFKDKVCYKKTSWVKTSLSHVSLWKNLCAICTMYLCQIPRTIFDIIPRKYISDFTNLNLYGRLTGLWSWYKRILVAMSSLEVPMLRHVLLIKLKLFFLTNLVQSQNLSYIACSCEQCKKYTCQNFK